MKILSIIVVFIFYCNYSFAKEADLRIAININQELFLKYKNAKNSIRNWASKLGDKKKVNTTMTFFKNDIDIYNAYNKGSINIAFFTPSFFVNHFSKLNKTSGDFWTGSYSEEDNIKYCLISNKKNEFKSFKDIKGKTLGMLIYNDTSYVLVNKMSMKENHKTVDKMVKNIKYINRESTVVLNVYFNKLDMGIIKKATWDTMLELNPSIRKKIFLSWCSENSMPQFVGVFNKKIYSSTKNIFLGLLSGKEVSSESREFFNILPFNHIYKISDKDIKKMLTFYKNYRELLNKYK